MKSTPLADLDYVHVHAALDRMELVIRRANRHISNFREEIQSLVSEPDLPSAYQKAYGRMVSLLSSIEEMIPAGREARWNFRRATLDFQVEDNNIPPDDDLVRRVKEAIEHINLDEGHFVREVEATHKALMAHAEPGIIDWSMPFEYGFSVLFNPEPTRRCYESCCGGGPLRIAVGHYVPDTKDEAGTNRNNFEDGHPLRNTHIGWLVYSLMEHVRIPWQLIPHIREIEFKVSFCDFETAWARQSASSS